MGDSRAEFETTDNKGTTIQQSGTVGTTPISIPDPAQESIAEFIIQAPDSQDIDNRLLVSMDGGSNFITLQPSGHLAWTPKGRTVTQLTVKGNQAGVNYEAILNLEED